MLILIIGCGRVGSELALQLSRKGHDVVVIDKDPDAFKELGESFNGITLTGDGFDIDILKEAGIKDAGALCSVTNSDNVNVIAAQIAKKIFKIPHVVARIYDTRSAYIYQKLGVTIISGTELLAAMINNKVLSEKFSAILLRSEDVGMVELKAGPSLARKTVSEIDDPPQLKVAALIKDKRALIPKPDAVIEQGDVIVCVVRKDRLGRIEKLLSSKNKAEEL